MHAKNLLYKYVDAVVSGDEEAEKKAFSLYSELKTQELLWIAPQEETTITEAFQTILNEFKALLEAEVYPGVELDGNIVS